MAHRVFISGVSVYDKDGSTEVVRQGELLPDYVDEYQRFVLSQTGMVKFEPDNVEPPPGADNPVNPAPVRLAEHPPLGSRLALSEQGTPAAAASQRMVDEGRAPATEVDADVEQPPAQSAPKAEWVEWAVGQRADGVSEDEARDSAESMTKADLVNRFGAPR